jgi:hypothetical protein
MSNTSLKKEHPISSHASHYDYETEQPEGQKCEPTTRKAGAAGYATFHFHQDVPTLHRFVFANRDAATAAPIPA